MAITKRTRTRMDEYRFSWWLARKYFEHAKIHHELYTPMPDDRHRCCAIDIFIKTVTINQVQSMLLLFFSFLSFSSTSARKVCCTQIGNDSKWFFFVCLSVLLGRTAVSTTTTTITTNSKSKSISLYFHFRYLRYKFGMREKKHHEMKNEQILHMYI